MATAKTFQRQLFTGVDTPGNLSDALLRLLLIVVDDAAPSADTLTYLRSFVGDDLAVSWIEQRLNDATEKLNR